ncbi:MAG: hypothetical protein Q4C00_01030 [Bacillota bacterium]|nr:hypothetical protein [Bacillota bacterium]
MKDKDKIREHWQLKNDITRLGRNKWRSMTKEGSVTLGTAKKGDPYINSRLAFWQWLLKEGNLSTLSLRAGKNGSYSLSASQGVYYAVNENKSKTVDFGDRETVKEIGAVLGKFHTLAEKFDWQSHCLPVKKPARYISRMDRLLAAADKAKGYRTSVWPEIINRSQGSMALLCRGSLEKLTANTLAEGAYTYGLIDRRGFSQTKAGIELRDITAMAEEPGILDIWRLCRQHLLYCSEPGAIDDIVRAYEREHALTTLERQCLYGFILFPYEALKSMAKEGKSSETAKLLKWEEKRTEFYQDIYKKGKAAEDENSH